jgi:Condensation domain
MCSAAVNRSMAARLSEAKRALLMKRLRGKDQAEHAASDARLPAVVPDLVDRHEPFPLTAYQAELWQATQHTGVAPWFYLETQRKGLDLERFERTWRTLVSRQHMLRAVILPQGAQQVLEETPPFSIKRLDCSHSGALEQDRHIEQVRREMLAQPRAQDRWPQFEIRATRLAEDEYRLHFGFNTLLFDLASIELMAADCKYLYHDQLDRLPSLEVSFRDLVLCEESFDGVEEAQRSQRFWRERLPQLPGPLALDPPSGAPRFGHYHFVLDQARWQAIRTITKGHGVTASMVVFAAFNEVLGCELARRPYALESRIFRRLPVHKNIYDVAGQFVAGVVSSVDVGGVGAFIDRCRALEQQVWRDLEHGYVDAARLWRQRTGSAPHTPHIVFTSTVARFENFVRFGAEPPLKWFGEQVYARYQQPNLGLEYFVVESAGALESHWFVDESLFQPRQLDALFARFVALLERLATDPNAWRSQQAIA